jgi:uncharacterized protein (TIGR04255 family)
MHNVDFFRLWNTTAFKELYPSISEYVEMPAFSEVFGVPESARQTQFVFGIPEADVLRYNFRNEQLAEQIQIQRNRIAFYWQKNDTNHYPRFPYIHEKFLRDFNIFRRFISDSGLGEIVPNQCAISYNNDVLRDPHGAASVVTFFRTPALGCSPARNEVESVAGVLKSVIEVEGNPIARMYVSFETRSIGKDGDKQDALGLELIVRGPPESPDIDAVSRFFETGRRQIVTTFDSITTKEMHEIWGKQ